MTIEYYPNPDQESALAMAPSGSPFVHVSARAHVTANLANKFDKQTKAGQNFGRVKFLGAELMRFSISFEVLAGREQEDFDRGVIPLLRRKGRNGVSPPFDIGNFQVQKFGITTVTVLSAQIGPPDARTGRMVTIELEEWSPKPVEPKADLSAKANNDPLDINAGLAIPVESVNQG